MRGLFRVLGTVFLLLFHCILFAVGAVFKLLFLLWKAVWYIIKLPFVVILYVFEWISPNYRRRRLHARFAHAQEKLQRQAEANRQNLSRASAKKNTAELADLVLAALRSRHRDIAPSIFDEVRLLIRKCAEETDVQTLARLMETVTRSDRRHLNSVLMEIEVEKAEN